MKTLLVVLAVLGVVGGGTVLLVNHFGGWTTLTGKAWAITYEVSAEPAETLAEVTYAESATRYRNQRPQTVTTEKPLPWQLEVVVNARETAKVSATPRGAQALTCRILLDGVKELAAKTGKPGETVTCDAALGA
ncbi:MmpS family transport accessory protein [Lentzea sp. NPDC003310]|uniref:MmpS family transport accessory protein n=1 Tax=Lentzea sp. NPDC003310 TaxID=3154447 RepID=UPI0033A410C1